MREMQVAFQEVSATVNCSRLGLLLCKADVVIEKEETVEAGVFGKVHPVL